MDGLKAQLLEGEISEVYDTARPSTRLCLTDDSGVGTRVHAAICLPFKSEAPPISIETQYAADEVRCSVEFNGKTREYVWGREGFVG